MPKTADPSRFDENWVRISTKIDPRAYAWLVEECKRQERRLKVPVPLYKALNEVLLAYASGRPLVKSRPSVAA